MTDKTSPGPWKVSPNGYVILDKNDRIIATMDLVADDDDHKVLHANAHVMAASHDMLNWLQELLAQVQTLSKDAKSQISPFTLYECKMAILKAKGERVVKPK